VLREKKDVYGKTLGHIVVNICKKYSLELEEKCVRIGTDNCAVMSSEINGAVQEICKFAGYARQCSFMNHYLNNSLKKINNILACQKTICKMIKIIALSNSPAKITTVFRTLLGRSRCQKQLQMFSRFMMLICFP